MIVGVCMGSIRQRTKKKKSYTIQYYEPAGPDGTRRRRTEVVHGTRKDAEAALAERERSIRTGDYVFPSNLSVAKFLLLWLELRVKKYSPKTLQEYKKIINNHLIPHLGNIPLQSLTPMHIEKYLAVALISGRLDGNGGLSSQTVRHHYALLHKALYDAVRWELLTRNPSDAVDGPKVLRKEMKVLIEEEIAILIEAIFGTSLFIPVVIALSTGIRRGENLGLTWADVDYDRATITIRRSMEQTIDGVRAKETKTHRSTRPVAMPDYLRVILKKHKVQMKLRLGPDFSESQYVCLKDDNTTWRPDTLSSCFSELVGSLNITKISFHDLRHTFATVALKQGIHPKVVSEALGHSSVNITLDIYSHVLPSLQREAAEKIDDALKDVISRKKN